MGIPAIFLVLMLVDKLNSDTVMVQDENVGEHQSFYISEEDMIEMCVPNFMAVHNSNS